MQNALTPQHRGFACATGASEGRFAGIPIVKLRCIEARAALGDCLFSQFHPKLNFLLYEHLPHARCCARDWMQLSTTNVYKVCKSNTHFVIGLEHLTG